MVILIVEPHVAHGDELVSALVAGSGGGARVLVLTEDGDSGLVWRVFLAGARACLLKSAQLDELVSVVRMISQAGAERFVLSLPRAAVGRLRQGRGEGELLTRRECEVLRLAADGLSNSEISNRLFIAEATVKRHLTNAYAKLDTPSRGKAVHRAFELGILPGRHTGREKVTR
ncbi:response regulator transcription factor [Nonomuraea sp. K274]|uniref:Response regulator transcription factor n=1 Tax=Nonomuraea cypriaca TaxID=1187855 RepID=A0A931AFJ0_9ACTN|nr:response regulator transcription factor [Nonomuraea cypriaca]MBF8191023.1 response regulator transcription factor [Nonomuraea cypriaca]